MTMSSTLFTISFLPKDDIWFSFVLYKLFFCDYIIQLRYSQHMHTHHDGVRLQLAGMIGNPRLEIRPGGINRTRIFPKEAD